jgi:hypothetical protein
MRKLLPFIALVVSSSAALAIEVNRTIVTDQSLSQSIVVQDARVEGSEIVADVTNRTPDTVSDIRLLVGQTFLWRDERHPREDDDPSTATTVTLPGPIPPNERVTVRIPFRPRPPRPDGRFVTRVEVLGIVRQERAPAVQPDLVRQPNIIPADR